MAIAFRWLKHSYLFNTWCQYLSTRLIQRKTNVFNDIAIRTWTRINASLHFVRYDYCTSCACCFVSSRSNVLKIDINKQASCARNAGLDQCYICLLHTLAFLCKQNYFVYFWYKKMCELIHDSCDSRRKQQRFMRIFIRWLHFIINIWCLVRKTIVHVWLHLNHCKYFGILLVRNECAMVYFVMLLRLFTRCCSNLFCISLIDDRQRISLFKTEQNKNKII